MPDISSISIGLQSIKTAIDISKDLRNIDSSFKIRGHLVYHADTSIPIKFKY